MQKLVYKNLILVAGTILLMAMQTKTFKITQTDDLKEVMKSGEKIYKANCLSCHQINGSGVPSLAPPLIKTSYVLGEKSHLIHIVLDGFNDDVEIEGEYYSNPMPAFNQLTDKEIADVLTYVRNSFGNSAIAVTANDVKIERKKINSTD